MCPNNENKPVTNSKDTQEVKLEQGLKIIKIFKEHKSKTCIVDDFSFYEVRQNTNLEKTANQQRSQRQVQQLYLLAISRLMGQQILQITTSQPV